MLKLFLTESRVEKSELSYGTLTNHSRKNKDVPHGPKPGLVWAAWPAWACRAAGQAQRP